MKRYLRLALILGVLGSAAINVFAAQGPLEGVINVNTATATELMLLPGVGEAKAQVIIDARSQKPFATAQDLLGVKGIGPKMIEKWAPYLAFTGRTTLAEKGAAASAGGAASAVTATK